jgi:hypothetical protein
MKKKLSRGCKFLEKIKVNWIDIVQGSGWTPFDDIRKKSPAIVASLGFFFYEDDEKFIIVDCVSDVEEASWTVFPKGCIKSIVKLEAENE